MEKIQYVSAIPGIGKTKWAVEQLVDCIQKKTGIAIYVAPTVDLLAEVKKYIEAGITGGQAKQVLTFHSRDEKFGSVTTGIKMSLEGGTDQHGRVFKRAEPGTVLLITHSGFLGLKSIPRSTEINLYFDEARKCVSQSNNIKMTSKKQKGVISQVFDFLDLEGTDFKTAKVKVSPSEYRSLMKTTHWDARQKKGVDTLVKSAVNPRFETYVKIPKSATALSMFEVTLPAKIFEGFKNVYLLSAYFEDSQMYHLLKLKKTPMVDITKSAVANYGDRLITIQNRYAKVNIVPLMPQEKALSKNHLQGFLVSNRAQKILEDLSAQGYNTRKDLRILKEYVMDDRPYKISERDQAAVDMLKANSKHVNFDPLAWFLAKSRKLVASWKVSYEKAYKKKLKKPLLIVNKTYQRRAEEIAPDMQIISTQVHGLNKFYKHDMVVFLAAINPSPALFTFYKHFLPNYDVEKDHVADVCIQCVCRGSVRDTKATSASLVIVPDLKIAALLFEKMRMRPSILPQRTPRENMVAASLSSDTTKSKVRRKEDKLSSKEKQARYKQNPFNREISNLRVNISQYKKRVANGYENAQAKLDEYQEKLKDLIAKRDAAKENK